MYSKSAIALVAALGTFAFAVPTVSHAADQSEWLQRQLQMTDGYAPPPVLPAQGGDRAAASAIRGGALRTFHPGGGLAPRPRRVIRQPATAHEAPACQEACAGGERPPVQEGSAGCGVIESTREVGMHDQEACVVGERPLAQVECAKCSVIEPTREVDTHGEGTGLVAVGLLLVVAGFKVMTAVGAIQRG